VLGLLTWSGAVAVTLGLGLATESARGQRVDPARGKTIVVGTPAGPSPADRADAARSGASRAPLPTGTLHVAWRRSLGLPIEAAPLVDGRGDVTILTARGDLVVLAADGEERSDTVVGSAAAGAATLLSDGTAAFLTTAGDVVGVRLGGVRFRTHVGGGRSNVSPLALDDGGVVVATQGELVALDGEGNVRARAAVDPDDPPVHALVGGPGPDGPTAYALTTTGAVLAWVPGPGREATHVGSFRGPTDGGMALVRATGARAPLLVAVEGAEIVTLDAATGTLATRAAAVSSGALAFLGPVAVHGDVVSVLGLTASRTLALAFDLGRATDAGDSEPGAVEVLHQAVAPTIAPGSPDGGVNLGAVPPYVGPLVDPHGDIAFALPSGELGVASPAGTVDVLSQVCARSGAPTALASLGIRGGPTYAGLAPAGPSAIIAACGTGVVVRVDSDFAPSP
jgi:hypothetical protein